MLAGTQASSPQILIPSHQRTLLHSKCKQGLIAHCSSSSSTLQRTFLLAPPPHLLFCFYTALQDCARRKGRLACQKQKARVSPWQLLLLLLRRTPSSPPPPHSPADAVLACLPAFPGSCCLYPFFPRSLSYCCHLSSLSPSPTSI